MTWLYVPGLSEPKTNADWNGYEPWVTLSGKAKQRPRKWNGWKVRGWIEDLVPGIVASGCFPSATDMEGSPLDLARGRARSVELNEIHTLPPSLLTGCGKEDSTTARSGMTLQPSMADLGVVKWKSSLPAFHALTFRLLEGSAVLMANIGFGPKSSGLLTRWDPDSLSWKTSPISGGKVYPPSYRVLPHSASMRSGRVCPQPRLVLPINENASGFSPGETPPTFTAWPTPKAADGRGPHSWVPTERLRGRGATLADVATWVTPTIQDDQKPKMWGTPRASDAFRGTDPPRTNPQAGAPTLKQQVSTWPIPAAHDSKAPSNTTGRNSATLRDIASHHSGEMLMGGSNGSEKADLSPYFVASLMGLPEDWLIHSTLEEMVSSRNAQGQQSMDLPDESLSEGDDW